MRFWIIGQSGMLSNAFQRYFVKRNISFFVTSREDADITSAKNLEKVFENETFDYVINASGYTQVDKAEKEASLAILLNSIGVKNLSILCKKHDKKLIHFSTDYVFDGKKKDGYVETDLTAPISVYGMSKRDGELQIAKYTNDFLIFRVSWLFDDEGGNFVLTMLKLLQERDAVNVVSDQFGSPTYALDVIESVMELLDQVGIYHIANRGVTSWYLFAKEIALFCAENQIEKKADIFPIKTKDYKTDARRPMFSYLDTTKAAAVIGKDCRDWKIALRDCLEIICK